MSKSTRNSDSMDSDLELRMSSSPNNSPLQFILTYETMLEQAKEAEYQQKSTTHKILSGIFFGALVIVSLGAFMVAMTLIGSGASLLLSCHTKSLFLLTDHPVSGIAVGILATALLHSSSTVTSLTVALVGTSAISLRHGIYVVMGANIGTCVTAEMVAFGQARDRTCFQRALGAAMIHTLYNIWSVIVMLPLELVFHPLEKLSLAMAHAKFQGADFKNPIKAYVVPLAERLLKLQQKTTYYIVSGNACSNGTTLIDSGALATASPHPTVVGWITLLIGFVLLVITLLMLSKVFSQFVLGGTKRAVSVLGRWNGYLNIVTSTLFTFVVSSSSLATSIVTPLVGLEALTLDQVYPLIIGANLGTTANALIAAFATHSPNAIALALVHFWFNVFGIPFFYVLPSTRQPVLRASRTLAVFGAAWMPFAVLSTLGLYYVLPVVLLLVVSACRSSHVLLVILGYVCVVTSSIAVVLTAFWYHRRNGRRACLLFCERKRMEREIRKYGGNLAMPVFVDDALI